MNKLVLEAFRNDPKIKECKTRSFKNVLNKNTMTSVYLAAYCDHLLKRGLKSDMKMSDSDQSEETFNLVAEILQLLDNKDTFLQSYQ
jgi:hypothetical protein